MLILIFKCNFLVTFVYDAMIFKCNYVHVNVSQYLNYGWT